MEGKAREGERGVREMEQRLDELNLQEFRLN